MNEAAAADTEADTFPDEGDPEGFLNADNRVGTGDNGKVSFTIDEAADRLVGSGPGWSGALGVGFTVTYAYRATTPGTMPNDSGGFERFNAAQMRQTELAMNSWSEAANIVFVRVGAGDSGEGAYSDDAMMLLGGYTSGIAGSAGFAYYPGNTSVTANAGDVWINMSLGYNVTPQVGAYGPMVLVHEIGHSIGLTHPSRYNAASGTTSTYGEHASYYEDSRQYTVMSYFNESNTGGNFRGRYASSPMLDDIAAVQLEYGVNMNTRTGDTVYGFNSNADQPWLRATSSATSLIFAVWDAGGNDTLDFSGYSSAQTIDLRAGYFSSVGGLVGNVAIAQGAAIENARGGFGADIIHGNSLNNSIFGGGGNDVINGGGGSNLLRGDDGNDSLTGGADFDDINGNRGNDTARGGLGNDWVVGGQDDDQLFGDGGNDIVYGNLGSDTCSGGEGNDWVRGGQGDDVIEGGAGDDLLWGDRGADTLTGGAGADVFHIFNGAGTDRVTDFNGGEGDRLAIDDGAIYTLLDMNGDLALFLPSGDMLLLTGHNAAGFQTAWVLTA